jgi:hypothetical protein
MQAAASFRSTVLPPTASVGVEEELMVDLMEPLDVPQQALLDIVWPLFSEHRQFPFYSHVSYQMRQQGLDAAVVMASLPALRYAGGSGRYRAIDFMRSGGDVPQMDSRVFLTMAGVAHVKDDRAKKIVEANLAFLRAMTAAHAQYAEQPFKVPNVNVRLTKALATEGIDAAIAPWAGVVAEHEWPAASESHSNLPGEQTGTLGLLTEASFSTVEEYLTALTAVTTPQQRTRSWSSMTRTRWRGQSRTSTSPANWC